MHASEASMTTFCMETESIESVPLPKKVISHSVTTSCHRSIKSYSYLDCLHDSVLINIQERLNRPFDLHAWALSCKRLYALEAFTRKKISIRNMHMFPALTRRYPYLQHLDLSGCTSVSDNGLRCVALYTGSRLLSLSLSTVCTFSNAGLVPLAKECTSLIHLNLGRCLQIADVGIMAISHIRTLQSLMINGCTEVSDSSIAFLAFNCRNLRFISLKWCVGITDAAVSAIGAHCFKLEELDVSYTEITNASIFSICKLKSLTKLSLAACGRVNDDCLKCFKTGIKSLKSLDVSRCLGISCKGIMELAHGELPLHSLMMAYCNPVVDSMLESFQKLENLRAIRFDACDLSGIKLGLIGKCCTKLEELSLSKCKGVQDSGLSGAVMGCPNLKNLDLTCCYEITDLSLSSIASCCKDLVTLKMESCNNFSEHGLEELCKSCFLLEELDVTDSNLNDACLMAISKFRNLKCLKLGICENIHDKGLSYIATNCLNLRELDLYRSIGISDEGIVAICGQCKRLTDLNMSYCTEITDRALFAVAQLKDLRTLELRGCTRLSALGLFSVATNCQSLLGLDLKRCTSLEDYAPLVLGQYCKNLKQVDLSYCAATDQGLVAVARGRCMQNLKLVNVKNVSVTGYCELLLAGEILRKVKLQVDLKEALPGHIISHVEGRGCRIRWMQKL
ncbi:hypothetical protein KP509_10G008500 [Ceratopteris richardii]|uniref:F-box/LRR-repeat protein 15-like leucin rich repeat domain-containing protein n=1 Tax=Ceratopteris richardii TaxID=49495 RepID=A0A8T2U1U3_CERRI|nr:hypothetical protein KP509_10G008500 [Ceratopteris richardii]